MNNPKVKIIDSALSSEDGSAYLNEDHQSSYIDNKKTEQLVRIFVELHYEFLP